MTQDPQIPTDAAQPEADGTIRLRLNGDDARRPAGTTVRSLLAESKLQPRQVAVEVNRRLRREDQYDEPLADGDAVEVVTFVGGG